MSAYRSADRGPWVAPRRADTDLRIIPVRPIYGRMWRKHKFRGGVMGRGGQDGHAMVCETGPEPIAGHAFACFGTDSCPVFTGCRCHSDQGQVAHVMCFHCFSSSKHTFASRSNVVPATPIRCQPFGQIMNTWLIYTCPMSTLPN